jgi:hypothetical protein
VHLFRFWDNLASVLVPLRDTLHGAAINVSKHVTDEDAPAMFQQRAKKIRGKASGIVASAGGYVVDWINQLAPKRFEPLVKEVIALVDC